MGIASGANASGNRLVRFVVLAVWAVFTAEALGFVAQFGTNAPCADEWEFVPALTGNESLLSWLWTQHNEHRFPLPRLVYFALFQITHDFRAGMVLQVVMLSGLCLWLLRIAARFRGRAHWADLFFPISLLHVGHWENLLIGYQICFVAVLVLATAIGVIALRTTPDNTFRSGVQAGLLAILLVLCGGSGVVAGIPVAAWLLVLARTRSRRQAAILAFLAAVPIAYAVFYMIGYQRPEHHPELGKGGAAVGMVAAETIAVSFGIGIREAWWSAFAAAAVVAAATLISILIRAATTPATRPAAFGLLAVGAGIIGIALAIGLGRAGLGETMGLWPRYAFLTWPLLGLAFLYWVQRGGAVGRWLPLGLCAASAFAFPANTAYGLSAGSSLRSGMADIERDARAGRPPEEIVRHFDGTLQDFQQERGIRGIPMLRKARIGAFASPDSH